MDNNARLDVKKLAVLLLLKCCVALLEQRINMLHLLYLRICNECEELVHFLVLSQIKEPPHRIKNYIENVVDLYSEREFQSHFRLTWTGYEALEALLGPLLQKKQTTVQNIPVRKQLLVVLWLLATPDSYRSVAERFDLPKSSTSKSFMEVVKLLNKIANKIIQWPSPEEKEIAEEEFRSFGGLQHVIGAVDGAFIEIKAPREHPEVYTCRKCFYAMTLQAIALPSLKFTDSFAGYPGSVGDRRIFTNSPIYKNIVRDKTKYFAVGEYIVGDKAYPVMTWCVPPYINRRHLTDTEVRFNTRVAKTRQVIERAFALLFGRYRRLRYLDMNVTKMIPATILAACVLHNICLSHVDLYNFTENAIAEGEEFMAAQRLRLNRGPEREEDAAEVHEHEDENLHGPRFRDRLAQRLVN